jgi:salicylate hydroxylase
MSTVAAESWHDGGIGLIGDAAHAMLPFQAQGAVMAIEDAAILAPLLMTEPTAETAFARYESLRKPRVDRVVKTAKANGFAFHLEWPFSLGRDLVIAAQGNLGHLKRLEWLYGYDPAPEPNITAPPRPVSPDPAP